jgi:hypothetical protein
MTSTGAPDTFENGVYLRLDEWLLDAYGHQFEYPSLVPARYASRKLVPKRLS